MNNEFVENKKDIICPCSGTTYQQIKNLVLTGHTELDRVSRITGACSGCGGCESDMLALLLELTVKQ